MEKAKSMLTGILSGFLIFLSGFAVMYFMWTRDKLLAIRSALILSLSAA